MYCLNGTDCKPCLHFPIISDIKNKFVDGLSPDYFKETRWHRNGVQLAKMILLFGSVAEYLDDCGQIAFRSLLPSPRSYVSSDLIQLLTKLFFLMRQVQTNRHENYKLEEMTDDPSIEFVEKEATWAEALIQGKEVQKKIDATWNMMNSIQLTCEKSCRVMRGKMGHFLSFWLFPV